MGVNKSLVKWFKKLLTRWWFAEKEHRDYILCKEVYHCCPADLDNIEESTLNLHFTFYNTEKEVEFINSKRAEQSSNLQHNKK